MLPGTPVQIKIDQERKLRSLWYLTERARCSRSIASVRDFQDLRATRRFDSAHRDEGRRDQDLAVRLDRCRGNPGQRRQSSSPIFSAGNSTFTAIFVAATALRSSTKRSTSPVGRPVLSSLGGGVQQPQTDVLRGLVFRMLREEADTTPQRENLRKIFLRSPLDFRASRRGSACVAIRSFSNGVRTKASTTGRPPEPRSKPRATG